MAGAVAANPLRDRWLALTQRLTVPDTVAERWWRELSTRYSEPGRYYHTLEHIRELLAGSDEHARVIEERDALELAIWFHDIVYDARSGGGGKNERDSAETFRRFADDAHCLDASLIERVSGWIEATANHAVAHDDSNDCKLFLDLDMAVLAREPAAYDAYAAQVRAEYRHVWTPLFWAGRARFLEGTLAAPAAGSSSRSGAAAIFHSEQFQHLEPRARTNLAREAKTLRASLNKALVAGSALTVCVPLALGASPLGTSPLLRGAASGVCALAAGATAVRWFLGGRGFHPFPYAEVPAGRVAVLAASFNPPHIGHLSLLRGGRLAFPSLCRCCCCRRPLLSGRAAAHIGRCCCGAGLITDGILPSVPHAFPLAASTRRTWQCSRRASSRCTRSSPATRPRPTRPRPRSGAASSR